MNREDMKTISDLRAITGRTLRLRQYDSIASLTVSPTVILVAVETYDVTETVRETRYNRYGKRVVAFEKKGERWYMDASMEPLWDADFEPYVLRHFGRTETIAETQDRIEWQTMCHRPGNAKFPLDNASAVDEHYTPKMKDHFEK